MDNSAKNFQEFELRFGWVHHPDSHVLVIHLPGFRTNELKVQVTSTGKLRIAGERKPAGGRWLRFQREFEVPADADTEKISAKFEDGVLYIKQAKRTMPPNLQEQAKPKEYKPSAETLKTAEKPTAGAQSVREIASKNSHDKPKAQASAKQTNLPKPQAPTKQKEEGKAPATQTPKTTEKSSATAQSVPEVTPKNSIEKQTDDRPKAKANVKDASKEAPQKEKESSRLKEEEKGDGTVEEENGKGEQEGLERSDEDGGCDGVVAEERTGKKGTAKRSGGGIIRRGEDYEQVVDAVVKELRTKVLSLVLSVVIFVILYLSVTKKANVDGGEL